MEFLSLIEVIELSIKNNIIKILSKNSIFDYYDTNNWVSKNNKNIGLIENKIKIKNEKMLKNNSNLEYKVVKNYKEKYDVKILPIYVIMEEMTLGEITEIIDFMSYNMLIELSNIYFKNTKEFSFDIEIIKNIRNRSAHNNDLITEKYNDLTIINIIELVKKYVKEIDSTYDFNNIDKIYLEILNFFEKHKKIF